jgi:hypothetical protein
MTTREEAVELRKLLLGALPEETAPYGELPHLREVFLPKSHARALHPNSMLVVGGRGAGKSFWWNVLQEADHRALIETLQPDVKLHRSSLCVPGFGLRSEPARYPSPEALSALLAVDKQTPAQVWRALMVRSALTAVAPIVVDTDKAPSLAAWWAARREEAVDWPAWVSWVSENAGEVDRLLHEADQELERQGRMLVVLFDALDRCAHDWDSFYKAVRGLLETTLSFRSRARIRAKVFLRTDQFDERRLAGFADASKLLASRVELRWSSKELYALLFQLLANHPAHGAVFRGIAAEVTEVPRKEGRRTVMEQLAPWTEPAGLDGLWPVPAPLQHDADLQQALFHVMSGPAMGKNRRRGLPYRWVINHLWDAHERVTPRPFLLALRTAAARTEDERSGHDSALHYDEIKQGITAASRLRVTEVQEDYDWLPAVMPPLRDLTVPCGFAEIQARWDETGTIEELERDSESGRYRLAPAHLSDGAAGVVKDLEQLGILYRTRDGRENMPDIYRIHFGLKRKGGIRPPRSLG